MLRRRLAISARAGWSLSGSSRLRCEAMAKSVPLRPNEPSEHADRRSRPLRSALHPRGAGNARRGVRRVAREAAALLSLRAAIRLRAEAAAVLRNAGRAHQA